MFAFGYIFSWLDAAKYSSIQSDYRRLTDTIYQNQLDLISQAFGKQYSDIKECCSLHRWIYTDIFLLRMEKINPTCINTLNFSTNWITKVPQNFAVSAHRAILNALFRHLFKINYIPHFFLQKYNTCNFLDLVSVENVHSPVWWGQFQ